MNDPNTTSALNSYLKDATEITNMYANDDYEDEGDDDDEDVVYDTYFKEDEVDEESIRQNLELRRYNSLVNLPNNFFIQSGTVFLKTLQTSILGKDRLKEGYILKVQNYII